MVARKKSRPKLYYRLNNGRWRKARLKERLGRFYNDAAGLYYTRYAGEITGQRADDTVTYMITSRKTVLGPFEYSVPSATGNPVLVVAAEDYSGQYPDYEDPGGPNYLHYYTEALDAVGYAYDIWDVDQQGVPSHADVLSHYMDLSAYAGQTVEIHISYASDWATQNLGVFVDDIEITGLPLEDFETGMGDWTVSMAPGSGAFNNWERVTGAGFPEGPVMRTYDSVYFGFGFEAIDTLENRTAVMERVMQYLLPSP